MRRSSLPPAEDYDTQMARLRARIDTCLELSKRLRPRDVSFLRSLRGYYSVSALQLDWLNDIEEKLGIDQRPDHVGLFDNGSMRS